MEIPVRDRSSYLKGLLIIAKKDKQLFQTEKNLLKTFSTRLGFASDFYEETIRNLMTNKYIDDDAIKFSDKIIAESFISDGLTLAFSDKKFHEDEIEWLKKTALLNGITEEWFDKKLSASKKSESPLKDFALFSII